MTYSWKILLLENFRKMVLSFAWKNPTTWCTTNLQLSMGKNSFPVPSTGPCRLRWVITKMSSWRLTILSSSHFVENLKDFGKPCLRRLVNKMQQKKMHSLSRSAQNNLCCSDSEHTEPEIQILFKNNDTEISPFFFQQKNSEELLFKFVDVI